jgi:hypothetical protein
MRGTKNVKCGVAKKIQRVSLREIRRNEKDATSPSFRKILKQEEFKNRL